MTSVEIAYTLLVVYKQTFQAQHFDLCLFFKISVDWVASYLPLGYKLKTSNRRIEQRSAGIK